MIARVLAATLWIAALAGAGAYPAWAAECAVANADGAIAEGRLITRDDALILQLPQGLCLKGDDEFDNVEATTELHVFGANDAVHGAMAKLVGRDVHLRGRLMGAHTQHHKAPIIMEVGEADAL